MTILDIKPGICGHYARVQAIAHKRRSVKILIESDCEKITAFSSCLDPLDIKNLFYHPFNKNPIYEQAGRCGLHSACPIPCGVIKAAEVELGLALKRDVVFIFDREVQD
jgi:hypothetical protein